MQSKFPIITNFAEIFYEKINKSFLYFFIGDNGINFIKFEGDKVSEEFFCSKDELSQTDKIATFVKKHSKSHARIIINRTASNLEHENIPYISSIGKVDPIEKYCDTHFHSSDIYSYKVLSISKEGGDIWKSVINWSQEDDLIKMCLTLIRDNKLVLEAIYFYNFAIQSAAAEVAKEYRTNLTDALYSTVSVNTVSGISISFNLGNNILSSTNIEYPFGKSDEYIQGVIEQNLSDLWLKYKVLSENTNAKKINVFIIPATLKKLLEKDKNDTYQNLFTEENSEEIFIDKVLIRYFSRTRILKAKSKQLHSYYRYNLINNTLFKPVYISILLLIFYAAYTKIITFYNNDLLSDMYDKFSKTSEEIRLKAQDYPTVSNVAQLADLKNLHIILSKEKPLPFKIISEFLELNHDDSLIKKIYWELSHDNEYILVLDINVNAAQNKIGDALSNIESSIHKLKKSYPDAAIDLQRTSNKGELSSSNTTSLSLKIYTRGYK